MKLPSYRRINKGDYPTDAQSVIDRLAPGVNNGFDVLFDALNNKLTLSDNIAGSLVTVDVTVDATGAPKTRTFFKYSSTNSPIGVLVLRAQNLTNSSVYPTQAPFISFTVDNNVVNIVNVTGLQANNVYRLTLFAPTN